MIGKINSGDHSHKVRNDSDTRNFKENSISKCTSKGLYNDAGWNAFLKDNNPNLTLKGRFTKVPPIGKQINNFFKGNFQ